MFNLAALAWAALAMAMQPASEAVQAKDRARLEQLNTIWLKSYETRDRAALDAILGQNFIGLYGDTILSRHQLLDGLASRPQTRVKWENLRINLDGDTAVLDAVSTITTLRDGKEASARYHYVDVYLRKDREWRAIASHVVRLPN